MVQSNHRATDLRLFTWIIDRVIQHYGSRLLNHMNLLLFWQICRKEEKQSDVCEIQTWQICRKEDKQNFICKIETSDLFMNQSLML